MTALIPGIRPDLLLIKQVDQVGALNRLALAGGLPGPSPHRRHDVFGAPTRMPAGPRAMMRLANSRAASPPRVKIATPLPYS
jgi:hypothetical protein